MKLRNCKSELELFTQCKADPTGYAKYMELATPTQKDTKHYYHSIVKGDNY